MPAPVKVFTHKGYTCGIFKEGGKFRTVCQKAGKYYTLGKWSNLGAALVQSMQAIEMAYPNPINPSDYHIKKVKGSHGFSEYHIVKGGGPYPRYVESFPTKEEALRKLKELRRKETEEAGKHFTTNPIRHTVKGWYFGSQGPFTTRAKALSVMRAMFFYGYRGR